MKLIKIFAVCVILILCKDSYSQIPSVFSIGGGPLFGSTTVKIDDLNKQLVAAGLPQFESSSFFTFGGTGFVDIPFKKLRGLRVGGLGRGFTSMKSVVTGGITKSAELSYGEGGINLEYVRPLSKTFDFIAGVYAGTGELKINLYQSNSDAGNWNTIWGELGSGSATQNYTHNMKVRFYSAEPHVSLGVALLNYLNLKFNAGYLFTTNGDWKTDNDIPLRNVPSTIKVEGFNYSASVNFGLFFR